MLIGPVFTREVTTIPRNWRLFFTRALYVGVLFGLVLTAWLILIGSQEVHSLGDLSRFGSAVFALLAPLQLAMAVAFSALLTAAAVAQEKDRRTLDLLLMTNLSNTELVLGKLLASMLGVLVLIVAAIPLLMLITLLGGVFVRTGGSRGRRDARRGRPSRGASARPLRCGVRNRSRRSP